MANEILSCYICYDKETTEHPFAYSPCLCKGSIIAHLSCLEEQVKRSRICSICKSHYRLEYLPTKNGKEFFHHIQENGQSVEYTVDKHGKLDGIYIIRHQNGHLHSSYTYQHDMLHGNVSHYYPSGFVQSISQYKQNKLYGDYTEWYPNGTIKEESTYHNDVKHGVCFLWKQSGAIRMCEEIQYEHGKVINQENNT